MTPRWIVKRNGGRANTPWRVVLDTHSEDQARARFKSEELRMRQGAVELARLDDDGERLLRRTVAPRLRTRW